jgi:hypothetical protein
MTLRHAAVGLLLAGFLLEAATAGGRFAPEPLNFVTDLISSAAGGPLNESPFRNDYVLQQGNIANVSFCCGKAQRRFPFPIDCVVKNVRRRTLYLTRSGLGRKMYRLAPLPCKRPAQAKPFLATPFCRLRLVVPMK